MIIHDVAQLSEEWFALRLGKPTGSVFDAVMSRLKDGKEGSERRNLRAQLVVERLTGKRTETFVNQAMQNGSDREPYGRLEYEVARGVLVREVGFITHDTIACGVSPDGLVADDGMVQIKSPIPATHLDYMLLRANEAPSKYRWQIQGELWVAERAWSDFVSYQPEFPQGLRLVRRRVYRDDKAIAELEAGVVQFNEELDVAEAMARAYVEPA